MRKCLLRMRYKNLYTVYKCEQFHIKDHFYLYEKKKMCIRQRRINGEMTEIIELIELMVRFSRNFK